MLAKEYFVGILLLHQQGKGIHQITEELQLSRNIIRKYIRQPNVLPYHGFRPKKTSKLEPYQDYLLQRRVATKPQYLLNSIKYQKSPFNSFNYYLVKKEIN